MFDPYRKWLGILSKDQPPNFYRLLSLELFENDLDVIEAAVDRTMGFIRQYQSGEHATEAANLLNELARARICLLKPATKSEYDSKLKSEMGSVQSPVVEKSAPEMNWADVELAPALRRPAAPKRKKSKKNATAPWPWILAGLVATSVLLAALLFSKPNESASSALTANPPDVSETKPATPTVQATPTSSAPFARAEPTMPSVASSDAVAPPASAIPAVTSNPIPTVPITNLVPHGDMELPAEQFSKTFPVVTPEGKSIVLSRSEDNPHSGNACLHISGRCPWACVKILKLDIPPGKTIHGRAWKRADHGSGHFLLQALNDKGKVLEKELYSNTSKDWKETSWTLKPEELRNATQLNIELAAGTDFDVYFDDICVWVD